MPPCTRHCHSSLDARRSHLFGFSHLTSRRGTRVRPAARQLLAPEHVEDVALADTSETSTQVVDVDAWQQKLTEYLKPGKKGDASLKQTLRARRLAAQGARGAMAPTNEEQQAHDLAFTQQPTVRESEPESQKGRRAKSATTGSVSVVPNGAAFCAPEPQWFAVEVYYKEGTDMTLNTGRRVGVIGAWVERAQKALGPVKLPDGQTIDRVIESWIPKKQIKAINPKTMRKGNKTLVWDNAETLLFKAVMDDDLARYLERQMAPVSESLDFKVNLTSIRVAKQTGGAGMGIGGPPTRTMLHRYKFSRRVELLNKEVIEIPSKFASGEQDELEARMQKRYRSNRYHIFPVPCPQSFIDGVQKWLETEEEWDQEKSIRNSKNIALMQLFGVTEERLARDVESGQARKQALEDATTVPPIEKKPRKQRARRGQPVAELTPEQQADDLFNPSIRPGSPAAPTAPPTPAPSPPPEAAETPAQSIPPADTTESTPSRNESFSGRDDSSSLPEAKLDSTSLEPMDSSLSGGSVARLPEPDFAQQEEYAQPGIQQQGGHAESSRSPRDRASGAVAPQTSRRSGLRRGHEFMDEVMAASAAAPSGWNVGALPDLTRNDDLPEPVGWSNTDHEQPDWQAQFDRRQDASSPAATFDTDWDPFERYQPGDTSLDIDAAREASALQGPPKRTDKQSPWQSSYTLSEEPEQPEDIRPARRARVDLQDELVPAAEEIRNAQPLQGPPKRSPGRKPLQPSPFDDNAFDVSDQLPSWSQNTSRGQSRSALIPQHLHELDSDTSAASAEAAEPARSLRGPPQKPRVLPRAGILPARDGGPSGQPQQRQQGRGSGGRDDRPGYDVPQQRRQQQGRGADDGRMGHTNDRQHETSWFTGDDSLDWDSDSPARNDFPMPNEVLGSSPADARSVPVPSISQSLPEPSWYGDDDNDPTPAQRSDLANMHDDVDDFLASISDDHRSFGGDQRPGRDSQHSGGRSTAFAARNTRQTTLNTPSPPSATTDGSSSTLRKPVRKEGRGRTGKSSAPTPSTAVGRTPGGRRAEEPAPAKGAWFSPEDDSLPAPLSSQPGSKADTTPAPGWYDGAAAAAGEMYGGDSADSGGGWYTGEDVWDEGDSK